MPTLQHLPVELHELILKYHVAMMTEGVVEDLDDDADAEEGDSDSDSDSDSDTGRATEGHLESRPIAWPPPEIYSRALFPYNVASTCMLWYNILIKIPQCWTKVVFDVTQSPSRFLDVFLWSQDLRIDIVVIYSSHLVDPLSPSSANGPVDRPSREDRDLEYSRVSEIMDALRPHMHRCYQIAFDVAFDCCIPSPVEFVAGPDANQQLNVLSLRSRYTNDLFCRSWPPLNQNVPPTIPPGAIPSLFPPTLSSLLIEGGWFMDLFRNPRMWPLLQTQDHPQWHLDLLSVGFFKFGRAVNTIPAFVAALSRFSVQTLWFDHLGRLPPELDDDMSIHKWPTKHANLLRLQASRIIFDRGVSKRFLEELNAVAWLNATQELHFLFCEIPFISHHFFAPYLELKGVRNVSSLKNALCLWKGRSLVLKECTFDDEFLSWLQSPMVDMRVPADNMASLTIHDCPNFTPTGLMGFVDSRSRRMGLDSRIYLGTNWTLRPLKLVHLRVSGNSPLLSRAQLEYLSHALSASA